MCIRDRYGVDPKYYGLLFGTNALSLIICSQISARLLRTHTPRQLQRRALTSLACASLAAMALTLVGWMTLPLLMVCLICYMGSQGFVNPNSAALALSDQGKRCLLYTSQPPPVRLTATRTSGRLAPLRGLRLALQFGLRRLAALRRRLG